MGALMEDDKEDGAKEKRVRMQCVVACKRSAAV
jgi:hypothetical protein